MRIISLFSGVGGLDLAVEAHTGGRVVAHVEADPWCRRVLAARWPGVPCWDDVCTLDPATMPPVDVVCGGFPCQDLSVAGSRAGITGPRSGLWWEYLRIVQGLVPRPRLVVIENVPALLRWRGEVEGPLVALGYGCTWVKLAAAHVGAPHLRQRVFVVAQLDAPVGCVLEAGPLPRLGYDERYWPTMTVADARKSGNRRATRESQAHPGISLSAALDPSRVEAALLYWPTPPGLAGNNQGGAAGRVGPMLPSIHEAVRWASPCARDIRSGLCSEAHRERRRAAGRVVQLADQVQGRLSARWVEAIMDLPCGWVDPDVSDPQPYPGWPAPRIDGLWSASPQYEWEPPRTVTGPPMPGRPAQLRALGNAVVPAQAELALRLAAAGQRQGVLL